MLLRQARPRGAGVPRLSTLATMYPLCASIRCHRAFRPPQWSSTVWPAGSPYTWIRSGYRFDGSKSGGLMHQPSSSTPPPMSTRKNSTGVGLSASSLARSAASSANVRTTSWSGRLTGSTTGGFAKVEYVWNAQRPSGETRSESVPG